MSNSSARVATSSGQRSTHSFRPFFQPRGTPGASGRTGTATYSSGQENLHRARYQDRHAGDCGEDQEGAGAHASWSRADAAGRIRSCPGPGRAPRYAAAARARATVRFPTSTIGQPRTCEMSRRAQRIIEAAQKVPLPEGTYAVGLGLLISGLTAYAFQIIAFKALDKPAYAALNGLWIFVFVVAPGFFLPLEQEVGRAVADRRARGIGGGPVVKKAAFAGSVLAGGLIVVALLLAAFTPLIDRLFHGRESLLVCFVIALATYAVQHITRGTLSGNGRFGPYGMILAAEGILRVVPVVILYAAGIDNIIWYGLALAIPPVLASILALRGQHGLLTPGPPAEWSELSANLTLLFLGSLTAQALSYSAALGAILLAKCPVERAEAADFIVGFFIARIPILLFQAIQAALLPKLAALSGAGRHDDFRAGLKKLLMIVIGVGV